MTEVGSRGGRTSKRTTPQWRLDWLREHPDVGATAAAKELGVTRQHVYKLRTKLKAQALEAELDRLIPLPPDPASVAEPRKRVRLSPFDGLGSLEDLAVEPPASLTVEDLTDAQPMAVVQISQAPVKPSWADTRAEDRARELAQLEAAGSSAFADVVLAIMTADDRPEPMSDGVDLFEEFRKENPEPDPHDTGDDLDVVFAAMAEQLRVEREATWQRPSYREALAMGLVA